MPPRGISACDTTVESLASAFQKLGRRAAYSSPDLLFGFGYIFAALRLGPYEP
jgi:hypothetical protein